jgi:hypothetical protein
MFGKVFKIVIVIIFFILVFGCSNKYAVARDEGLISREWNALDADIVEQDDVRFSLDLQVKDFVEVKDSVKLMELYESERRRVGSSKILGGCAIAGCATLASACATLAWANNPSDPNFAWFYGIVGGVGALAFIVSGVSDVVRFERTESDYIRKNIICKNSTPLRNSEVKIMLKNINSEETYYTDENGIIQLKFDEIIPEPTEKDSIIDIIIQYKELVDSVNVEIK